jgi:hypothetical protein
MIQHIEVSRVMPVETELFDRYIYASNTQSAWKRVAENGGSAAPGGTTISELQKDFPALWRPVKESLRAETSQPPQLKRVTLRQHLALRLLLDRRPLGEGWVLVSTGGNTYLLDNILLRVVPDISLSDSSPTLIMLQFHQIRL